MLSSVCGGGQTGSPLVSIEELHGLSGAATADSLSNSKRRAPPSRSQQEEHLWTVVWPVIWPASAPLVGKVLAEKQKSTSMMPSFSRFEARDEAPPLHREACRDEARLVCSYALTVSRTHSSMRLNTSTSTSWLANSSESCWARSR